MGSHAVKVVWAATSRDGELWQVASRLHPPAAPSDTASSDHLAQALKELLGPLSRGRFDCPVLLSVSHGYVRRLSLEVPDRRQLPALLQERIAQVFPFELARCRYHYRLLGRQPVSGGLRCALQVAACERPRLAREVELLERIGWSLSHAYPAALAVAAVARAHPGVAQETTLVMDVGARHSVLALMSRGEVVFAREAPFGSGELTDALMTEVVVGEQTVRLSWEQAESLKCRLGLLDQPAGASGSPPPLPPAMYHAMLQPVLGRWLEEIRRTVAAGVPQAPAAAQEPSFETGVEAPTRVVVCGGGAQLAGFAPWLSGQLSLPVEPLRLAPWLPDGSPAFAVAAGLLAAGEEKGAASAHRRARRWCLNLLPEPAQRAHRFIRGSRRAMSGFIAMLILLWGAAGVARLRVEAVRRAAEGLAQRRAELAPVQALARDVASQEALIRSLTASPHVPVEWFRRLATGFPDPIRLTELSVAADGEVSLTGQAQAREQSPEAYVSQFAMWLAQARLCDGVRLGSSRRHLQEDEVVDFTLTCQRRPHADRSDAA
jgi:Tfp pilus assembly PilM family ATPase